MEGETNGQRTEHKHGRIERKRVKEKNKPGEIVGWAKRCNVHISKGEMMEMDSEAERDGWFDGLGK